MGPLRHPLDRAADELFCTPAVRSPPNMGCPGYGFKNARNAALAGFPAHGARPLIYGRLGSALPALVGVLLRQRLGLDDEIEILLHVDHLLGCGKVGLPDEQ